MAGNNKVNAYVFISEFYERLHISAEEKDMKIYTRLEKLIINRSS